MNASLKSVTLQDAQNSSPLTTEKNLALKALSEDSVFRPVNNNAPGPYDLSLSIQDGRLVMDMKSSEGVALPTLVLSVKPYTRLVRDYFMLIESYEKMRQSGTACQLEAVDMGRRGLHDEGATLLIDRLSGKIELDHATARRLFTLICVLHGQNFPVF
jgi:uncharacterized protein (UPF0262 family)